jgi:diguanylate cyclase (GGDEF)-like protein
MSPSEIPLPPGELQRLAECVLEPIRFPASIQPHGVFLAIDDESFHITHVSDNTKELIGAEPDALLGRPLTDLLDKQTVDRISAVIDDDDDETNPTATVVNGREFDVISRRSGRSGPSGPSVSGDPSGTRGDPTDTSSSSIFVELEPRLGSDMPAIMSTREAMRRMATAETVQQLWAQAAESVRKITGYDRVMVYHFYPDGHGEIVGEAKADDMDPYLGLHYPASDIPQQARQLYLTKHSRQIGNSGIPSAALLSDANSTAPALLDLSVAELRAVSPHHLEFMRNMGQVSTFSLSLIRDGVLIGMITCAHRAERRLTYNLRDGLELLANQLALQLGAMWDIERLHRRDGTRQIRATLTTQMSTSADMIGGLIDGHLTVLDLIPADGAAMRLNGRLAMIGTTPDADTMERLTYLFNETGEATNFVSASLEADHPEIAAALPGVAGLLMRRIGSDGDFIAWFRGEMRQTIDWLGDMSPQNRLTPLSPRSSFAAWREEVRGTSAPWDELEIEARELGRDIESALLSRVQARLAEQAMRDSLTGLPNRRLLMDRLEHALARHARGTDLALLFVDVDQFKTINDTYGHAVGDSALIHIASALQRVSRSSDTVGRLSGDEFVVLCEGTSFETAREIADRMRAAVSEAPTDGAPWQVSVSIGIAMADFVLDASHLLSAADDAMYRAKLAGRNQTAS